MFNRKKQSISKFVNQISKKTGIEKSAIEYFIIKDLERIIDRNIQFHEMTLIQLEQQIEKEKNETNTSLANIEIKKSELVTISKKREDKLSYKKYELLKLEQNHNKKIKAIQATIENIQNEINKLVEKKDKLQSKNENLKEKYSSLSSEVSKLNKENKKIEYNLMMSAQSVKEKSDSTHKRLKIYLTIITIIGVAIAIAFILTKK